MLTRESLNRLHELVADLARQKEIMSDGIRTAQDRNGHKLVKIVRDGKEIELKEKTLWDEVWYLGVDSDSGQALQERYPTVFEAFRNQESLAQEIKKFCLLEFGIDFTALSLSDYLKMTESLFLLLLEEHRIAQIVEHQTGNGPSTREFKAPISSPMQREDIG